MVYRFHVSDIPRKPHEVGCVVGGFQTISLWRKCHECDVSAALARLICQAEVTKINHFRKVLDERTIMRGCMMNVNMIFFWTYIYIYVHCICIYTYIYIHDSTSVT